MGSGRPGRPGAVTYAGRRACAEVAQRRGRKGRRTYIAYERSNRNANGSRCNGCEGALIWPSESVRWGDGASVVGRLALDCGRAYGIQLGETRFRILYVAEGSAGGAELRIELILIRGYPPHIRIYLCVIGGIIPIYDNMYKLIAYATDASELKLIQLLIPLHPVNLVSAGIIGPYR